MSSVYGQPETQQSAYQPGDPGYYYLPPGGPYPGQYGQGDVPAPAASQLAQHRYPVHPRTVGRLGPGVIRPPV